jgi:hypothetical protein
MLEKVKAMLGLTPQRARLLVAAPFVLLLAACNQVGTNQITFWDIFWSIAVFFLWITFIWMFVALFVDVVRRRDISGMKKALWIIFMLALPFLGILAYIVSRPQDAGDAWAMSGQAAPAGSGTPVDEIARLNALRQSGAITEAEFTQLKAGVIA